MILFKQNKSRDIKKKVWSDNQSGKQSRYLGSKLNLKLNFAIEKLKHNNHLSIAMPKGANTDILHVLINFTFWVSLQ